MVLYIFGIRGAAFVKAGFTAGCPWGRARDGFWRVVHPKACCNRLGWSDLELLGLYPGDLAVEARLHTLVPPECGEFWPLERLPDLRRALTDLAVENGCTEAEAELPMPQRPVEPMLGRGEERFECCGGTLLKCYGCGQHFKLWIRLQTHKRESCPASAIPKVACTTCGAMVIQRHLKRHNESHRCSASRHV